MGNSNGNRDIKFGLGFILGMAAGLAVGFIFAPKPGGEARELIKEKISDTGEKVKDIAADVSGTVKEIAADVRGTVQEAVGDRKKIYRKTWKQPKIKPYNKEL